MQFWFATGSAIVGVFFFAAWILEVKRYRGFKKHPPQKIKELMETQKYVSGEIGSGSFSESVKITGLATCENPVKCPLTGKDAIICKTEIKRLFKERRKTVNIKTGEPVEEWHAKQSDLENKVKSVQSFNISDPFDKNKKVFVSIKDNIPYGFNSEKKPDEEYLGMETILDEKVVYTGEENEMKFQYNGYEIDLFSLPESRDQKTTGFHVVEKIIPLNRKVFAYGNVDDKKGFLRLTPQSETKEEFFLSFKDESQSKTAVKSGIQGMIMFYTFFFILSAVLFYFHFS